jgi:hypothetical protein
MVNLIGIRRRIVGGVWSWSILASYHHPGGGRWERISSTYPYPYPS